MFLWLSLQIHSLSSKIMTFSITMLVVQLYSFLSFSDAWQQWKYSSFSTDDWRDIWGFAEGPRGRMGHSMVVFNETIVVLFGGQDNYVHRSHVPKTYDMVEKDGLFDFASYDDKPLNPNYDPACKPQKSCILLTNASSGNEEVCHYSWEQEIDDEMTSEQKEIQEELCGFVTAGLYYNDVWMYDLDCEKIADLPCTSDGWRVLHPGEKYGGCRNDDEGNRICNLPSERWGHSAAMLNDHIMVIYGGYSHECEDYCDDFWAFNLVKLRWTRITNVKSSNPGKRWKFSLDNSVDEMGNQILILFGGHRLWHGFATENSEENRWQNHNVYPEGGYLDDLWVFSLIKNESLHDTETLKGNSFEQLSLSGLWTKKGKKKSCSPSPGLSWESRDDVKCQIHWPVPRSGHASVFDESRKGLWVHGGFTSYYPYPSSNSAGSGYGTKSSSVKGFVPYAMYSFYLDDLWFYDIKSGFWEELKPASFVNPSSRVDHVLFQSKSLLILFGGYSNNMYFNDTWYYYIKENRWLRKNEFVHAYYPPSCTDDLEKINDKSSNCVELAFPNKLKRSEQKTYIVDYQDILPFNDQEGYTPDKNQPLYFGIVDNAEALVKELTEEFLNNEVYDKDDNRVWVRSNVPDGTPIAPHAATGLRQYAKKKELQYKNNTMALHIWEWCTSVKGEPTRGKILDGLAGRSNERILIPQLRRQSPGWDGCRELVWKYPPSRSGHKGVLVKDTIIVYGGMGYDIKDDPDSNPPDYATPSLTDTPKTSILHDLWVFNIHNCPRNCSDHGVCTNGFCKCDVGYYGIDCSNHTCPGSVCYYDENRVQHCTHCCHDGYVHKDDDIYVPGIRKIPCRPKSNPFDGTSNFFSGSSNGVCDGFGSCQCTPPFLGEDCSIKDCQNNCSFNGYCSLEYPVSRCICKEGYFGDHCQHIECPNNCTFPNGICEFSTGQCTCEAISFFPYNETNETVVCNVSYWEGEDCSFLPPCSRCSKPTVNMWMFTLLCSLYIKWLLH